MRSSSVVLLLVAAAAAWHLWPYGGLFHKAEAPALSYADTAGKYRSLGAPERPAVVVLWVSPCAYCTRAMKVEDDIRRLYAEEDLDVVAFYLNRAGNEEIERMAAAEGHRITVAQGQPDNKFVETLLDGLAFRGTGRDIYVIGKDGRYTAVDASDLREPDYAVRDRVRSVLLNVLKLKERA